jgi:predicted RNA-binding Zn ribbon-like protein
MQALPLDPGSYPGTYKLIGGRPSLDLVNTISWPGSVREHDWLALPANIDRWCAAAGLVAITAPHDVADVAVVRQVLTDVLRPMAHHDGPATQAADAFNRTLGSALGRRLIDLDARRWAQRPIDAPVEAFDPVLLDAADLIMTDAVTRLKACPACDWLFLDATRNAGRRWCDMTDCGSRAKSRTYYHRQRIDT